MRESTNKKAIGTALVCAALLTQGIFVGAQTAKPTQTPAKAETTAPAKAGAETPDAPDVKIPEQQLDALVAPIALYPDPLLSQTLVASTYPLELVQLHQWLLKNKTLKDKALTTAVKKQPWDPS